MPRRTDQHVISDIALNRVQNVFSDCGWACEVVHQDYGEDLLVQTSYGGMMDPFKIWIQVKGTTNLQQFSSKKYGYSIRVPLEHAFKWARSQDLVAVVLWDIDTNRALWSAPKDELDEWNWRTFASKHVRLRFRENAVFDVNGARKISWEARIGHYNNRYLSAGSRDISLLRRFEEEPADKSKHFRWAPLVAFDFLRVLLILGSDNVDEAFLRSVQKARRAIRRKDKTASEEDVRKMAIMLAVLVRVGNLSHQCGMPEMFLEGCCEVIEPFLDALDEPNSGMTVGKLST